MNSSYDQTQYESYSYSQTHPEHLYTLARLFGLNPPDFQTARVLELGCASGGNLIPMAFQYPSMTCVGIDLSAAQVDAGRALIQALELKNIELRNESLMDFDGSEYDYIICHGLYSWVDKDHQEQIMKLVQKQLNPLGIAYISYNTYPGWRMVQSIRDMMLYHTQGIHDPEQKAQQARALLNFIVEGLEGEKTPYADFLRYEIELLKKQPNSYLLHDHLEEHNQPLYFYEFIDKAAEHQLSYLSDAHLVSMYVGNLPQQFAQELGRVNNIVLTNQYMDFIRNQRFRATLLCHASNKIDRQLNSYDIEKFYLSYGAKKMPPLSKETLKDESEVRFIGQTITLTTSNPIAKSALNTIMCAHQPISYQELLETIQEDLNRQDQRAIEHHLNDELNMLRLVLGGLITIHSTTGQYVTHSNSHPQTTDLVLKQLQSHPFVTNQRHETVRLNQFETLILQLLNGEHDEASIVEHVFQNVSQGKLSVFDTKKNKIQDEKQIKQMLQGMVQKVIGKFAEQALLIH